MGFGFDLVTKVESVQEMGDEYIVEIEISEGLMAARSITVIRARARAMIATGVIENVGNRSRDIADAITSVEFDEISRATEVVDGEYEGDLVTVKVNK